MAKSEHDSPAFALVPNYHPDYHLIAAPRAGAVTYTFTSYVDMGAGVLVLWYGGNAVMQVCACACVCVFNEVVCVCVFVV